MRIIGRFAPVLTAVTVAFVLAGCGSGPSQVSSAAIVGQHAIPLDEVQQEIQWLLANVPAAQDLAEQRKFDNFSRKIVQERVIHELLLIAAEREGLQADPAEVTQLIESSGGTEEAAKLVGVEPDRVRELAADQILLQQLGEKYVPRLSVDVVGAVVTGESPGSTAEDRALALGEQIAAAPERAPELVAGDGRQVIDQQLALSELLGSDSAALAASALFGVAPGTVVVIQPNPQQGAAWLVALVRDRKVGTAGEEPGQADPQTLYNIGLRMLAPIAREAGVRINPRYGVWDQAGMTVAADERDFAGHLIPARTVRP
ncbi:MAG: SurA N-terminal domain-containing protein [Pseudonocardiaceae bacterium]